MIYIANIPIDQDNNCFLLRNNVIYAYAKFMQAGKMSKKLIDMFFNNLDLIPIQQHLNQKNKNKMKALLMKLSYGKVIW